MIEKIRQEIEKLRKLLEDHNYYLDNSEQALGYGMALDDIGQFLDTLSAEETPEPYTGKYDEAYLQEKIAKATKSWEGVDVDKFMDEMRGRETPTDLEEEIVEYWKVMGWSKVITLGKFKVIARYFYGLGQNSK